MNWITKIIFFACLAPLRDAEASLEQRVLITAEAKNSEGQLAYSEVHEIHEDQSGNPLRARTRYLSPEKKLKAVLTTDFKKGLSANDYVFSDERDGSSHGVEVKEEGYLLWKQAKGKAREEKLIRKSEFRPGDLVVSGQGLFFYLRNHLEKFPRNEKISVKLLIPGRLDFFSFDLGIEEETSSTITFKMRVGSLLLRIFTPSLHFKFEKSAKNLVQYIGPSNLVDESGDLQTVEILYNTDSGIQARRFSEP